MRNSVAKRCVRLGLVRSETTRRAKKKMNTIIIIILILSIINFSINTCIFVYALSKIISIIKLKHKLNNELRRLLNETESDLFELQ